MRPIVVFDVLFGCGDLLARNAGRQAVLGQSGGGLGQNGGVMRQIEVCDAVFDIWGLEGKELGPGTKLGICHGSNVKGMGGKGRHDGGKGKWRKAGKQERKRWWEGRRGPCVMRELM